MLRQRNTPPPRDSQNPWHSTLREALVETPGLVWVFPDASVPGPTLWRSLRAWVECLRALQIGPGDRVVLSGPPGFGWMGAALAGLWLRATLVPAPATCAVEEVAETVDASLVIGPGGQVDWDAHGQPQLCGALRPVRGPTSGDARFLLRTSGTGGEARWIALSDGNVLAVLDSHLPALGLGPGHRLLSTLPWSHAFGLVLEFLAALRARASLVRCATPADAGEQVRLARAWKLDWWCAVPAMVRRLAA
ncbi:MAG: AMP-binding protein, partial [Burkholderiales bacterium]|nr:AMP-binding protein [Opitutaceae bacterium]